MNSVGVGIPELAIVFFIACMALVVVWPAALICRRAGFSGWMGLLAIVPIASLVLLWYLALAPWPALKSQS